MKNTGTGITSLFFFSHPEGSILSVNILTITEDLFSPVHLNYGTYLLIRKIEDEYS